MELFIKQPFSHWQVIKAPAQGHLGQCIPDRSNNIEVRSWDPNTLLLILSILRCSVNSRVIRRLNNRLEWLLDKQTLLYPVG